VAVYFLVAVCIGWCLVTRRIVVGNGNCSGKFAVGIAYDLNHANNLDAFVGFPCSVGESSENITISKLQLSCP